MREVAFRSHLTITGDRIDRKDHTTNPSRLPKSVTISNNRFLPPVAGPWQALQLRLLGCK